MLKTKTELKKVKRFRRHIRIRAKIKGTGVKPRLAVFKSGEHLWAQLIDDVAGKTVLAVTDFSKEIRKELKGTKLEKANQVGKYLGKKAKAAGIKDVVFDRGGFLYQGRIKSFAEGAREAGLNF